MWSAKDNRLFLTAMAVDDVNQALDGFLGQELVNDGERHI